MTMTRTREDEGERKKRKRREEERKGWERSWSSPAGFFGDPKTPSTSPGFIAVRHASKSDNPSFPRDGGLDRAALSQNKQRDDSSQPPPPRHVGVLTGVVQGKDEPRSSSCWPSALVNRADCFLPPDLLCACLPPLHSRISHN